MVCDTRWANKTPEQRQREVREALARLQERLRMGEVKLVIGPSGAVAFSGRTDAERDGVADACAFRKLQAQGSPELRQALARAEATGRKVNPQAMASGLHSHDGGKTWGRH
jgi:hypothetical protein